MARRVRLFKKQQGTPGQLRTNLSVLTSEKRWSKSKITGRWERASASRRISDPAVQRKFYYKKERLELLVLRKGMSEANRHDKTIAKDPVLNFIVPENRIDIKTIILALREDILQRKIQFSRSFLTRKADVIVPSLRVTFHLWYNDGYLCFQKGILRPIKIPFEFEDGQISEEAIDVVCALIEYKNVND